MTAIIDHEDNSKKIAGIFNSQSEAKNAFDAISSENEFTQDDIKLISPEDANFGKKVEPEDKNIGKTLLSTHLTYGVGGLIIGLLISSILLALNFGFMQGFVFETYTAISIISIFIALLVAGFMSVRPDHDPVINEVRKAKRSGKWALIVHTDTTEKANNAKKLIQPFAATTTSTL